MLAISKAQAKYSRISHFVKFPAHDTPSRLPQFLMLLPFRTTLFISDPFCSDLVVVLEVNAIILML